MTGRLTPERLAEITKTLRALWPEAQRDVDALLGHAAALQAELDAAVEANQQLRAALGNLFGDLYLHHLGDITDAQLWASGDRAETAVRSLASPPGETKEPA